MNDLIEALKTNRNGARTKALIAAGITAGALAAGIYLTKKASVAPLVVVVEEAVETATEAATA